MPKGPTVNAALAALAAVKVKRDFFGRVIVNEAQPQRKHSNHKGDTDGDMKDKNGKEKEEHKVWVSFHEGFSNAVRKPISLRELMGGF